MLQEFKNECCEVLQKDKNEKKNEIFETLKVLNKNCFQISKCFNN